MAVIFVKNEQGWQDMVRGPRGPVSLMLLQKGRRLNTLARHQAGFASGRLYRSMGYAVKPYRASLMVEVGSPVKYALLHHEGTRPHAIYPRKAKMLRFARYGRINYRARVFHPGTRANHYLTDNLDAVALM
jgi:hypothetical protein